VMPCNMHAKILTLVHMAMVNLKAHTNESFYLLDLKLYNGNRSLGCDFRLHVAMGAEVMADADIRELRAKGNPFTFP
jgi:hypothetical protein